MSRLDTGILRLLAQRDCLNMAAAALADRPGPVLELGLGNGRTYSHLRERFPGREVWVFEREVSPHPESLPPPDRLLEGDLRDTLPAAASRIGAPAVFAHMDIGTGNVAASRAAALSIAPLLVPLLAEGAWIASDQPLDGTAGLSRLPLPDTVEPGRYHMYQRAG